MSFFSNITNSITGGIKNSINTALGALPPFGGPLGFLGGVLGGGQHYDPSGWLANYPGLLGGFKDGKFVLNANVQDYVNSLQNQLGKGELDYDKLKQNEINKINDKAAKQNANIRATLKSRGLVEGTPAYLQAMNELEKQKQENLDNVDLKVRDLQSQELARQQNILAAIQGAYSTAGGLTPQDYLNLGQQNYDRYSKMQQGLFGMGGALAGGLLGGVGGADIGSNMGGFLGSYLSY